MNELLLRTSFFVGIFLLMAGWEIAASRRSLAAPRATRWPANLSLVAVNAIVLRLLFPTGAFGIALVTAEWNWGLFQATEVPYALAFVLTVVALDLMIYLQHRAFHAVRVLWRLHRVHHADVGFDVTTATRFHPVEMVLSMLFKAATIVALGAPPAAVLSFEVLLNATSMFNHGNVSVPGPLDRVLRWLVVTPDMHRVHHSALAPETNSNFGFNLPWWDRLLGTYRDQPVAGHDDMMIGLEPYRDAHRQTIRWLLALPFAREGSARQDRHRRLSRRHTATLTEAGDSILGDVSRQPWARGPVELGAQCGRQSGPKS